MKKNNIKVSTMLKITKINIVNLHSEGIIALDAELEYCIEKGVSTGQIYGRLTKIIMDLTLSNFSLSYNEIKAALREGNTKLNNKEHEKVKNGLIHGYQSSIEFFYKHLKSEKFSKFVTRIDLIMDSEEKNYKAQVKNVIEEKMIVESNLMKLQRMTLGNKINFWMTLVGALGFLLALVTFIIQLLNN